MGFLKKRQANETAEELLKEESGFIRNLRPFEYYLVATIGIAWALYQLALPSFLIIDTTKERAIHLAFAISLLFFSEPLCQTAIQVFGFSLHNRPHTDYRLPVLWPWSPFSPLFGC